ncbi:MAG: VOC family protein [Pseudomonadota bacterium]
MTNPVFHFEIAVTDLNRAVAFYQEVFGFELRRETVDGYEMAFFPRDDDRPGCSGALAQGDTYKPSRDGSLIYFDVEDIALTLTRAKQQNGQVLYEKTDLGEVGYVAEIEDSEGNRVGLTQGPD